MTAPNPDVPEAATGVAPALRGRWLLGCGPRFTSDPLALYLEAGRLGDCVRLHLLPGVHCYFLSHPEAIEHVLLKRQKNYRKPNLFNRAFRLLGGGGLLSAEGEFWLQQRRLMQPAFHRQSIAGLAPKMAAAAESWLAEMQGPGGASEPKTVDVVSEMMRLALRIAGTTLFSTDISGDYDEIGQAFREAFAHMNRRMNALPFVPDWLPTAARRRFVRAKRLLDETILRIIEERRGMADPPHDLLALLLAAQDEETGVGMNDQQLKDEALTLLAAGHETVGAALSWTWYLLGQHPEIQEQVHEEVRGVLQGRLPTADDVPHLPFTRAVFDESMRLFPPAWGQPRESIEADEILGCPIPARSIIIVGTYVTHRRADLWPEPERFQPERFLGSPDRHKFAYLPFGGGPRVCIGQPFALLEGPLVLAALAQRLRLELVPGQTVTPDPTFTLRPKEDVKMKLVWRR